MLPAQTLHALVVDTPESREAMAIIHAVRSRTRGRISGTRGTQVLVAQALVLRPVCAGSTLSALRGAGDVLVRTFRARRARALAGKPGQTTACQRSRGAGRAAGVIVTRETRGLRGGRSLDSERVGRARHTVALD